jgi:hypothetical protein
VAFTFRGFGAMHYGERDHRADGSFVTTLWIVAAYVPLVPLHSKRVRYTGEVTYRALFPRRARVLIEKTEPHWGQVASVYAFFAVELAIFITARVKESWWIALPGILLLGLPWLLRRRSLERAKAGAARVEMGFGPEAGG